ncbi:MAG: Ig-like domain-containing protein [Planctomycetota bacterium]
MTLGARTLPFRLPAGLLVGSGLPGGALAGRLLFVLLSVLIGSQALVGCGGSGLGELLDPTRDDRDKGFDPGKGGGSVVKDLFAGVRYSREEPTILSVRPDDAATGVSIRTIIVIAFSESMDPGTVNQESVTFSEAGSGGSAIIVDQVWTQSQTVLVLAPQTPLQEETEYQVVIAGTIEDLQGQNLNLGEDQNSLTFSFTTGVDNTQLRFDVIDFSPKDGDTFAYQRTPVIAYFSEPAATGGGTAAADNPANFLVKRGGVTVAGAYQIAAGGRVVQFVPDAAYGADTRIDVTLSGRIVSAAGRPLNRGVDYKSDFTTFPTDSLTTIAFPENRAISSPIDADGFISTQNLHSFPADVTVTAGSPDKVTLLFVDAEADNGLIFEQNGASNVSFDVDLEPDSEVAALEDGSVAVGGYATKRGVEGPVDIVKTLYKDVGGFAITALGPPNGGGELEATLLTPLRDPSVYGQADQPLASFTITRAGTIERLNAIENWASPLEFLGQTTAGEAAVDEEESLENLFLMPPFTGAIGLNFDPVFLQSATGRDAFGNEGSASLTAAAISQVGIVGGETVLADPAGGLVCTAVGEDTYRVLDDTDVIVEVYPRDETGTGQIVDQVTSTSPATFTAADLAQLGPTEHITVTFVKDGYHLATLMGVKNPRANPVGGYGIQATLVPAALPFTIPVSMSSNNTQIRAQLSSNVRMLDDPDAAFTDADQPKRFSSVEVRPNQLKAFSVIATDGSGSDPNRILATRLPVFSDGVATIAFDLDDETPFSRSSSIAISPATTKASADAAGVYDTSPTELDLAEARIEARLPGFPGLLPLALSEVDLSVTEPTATLLLPASLTVNGAPSGSPPTGEDTALELVIQPTLAGSGTAVSPDALRQALFVALVMRNATDGRLSLVRSEIDFAALTAPVVVDDPVVFPVVPVYDLSEFDDTHPPVIPFRHTLSSEAVYRMQLVKADALVDPRDPGSGTYERRWDVLIPPGLHTNPDLIVVAFPDLAAANSRRLLDNNVDDFALPGTYGVRFEGFDFADFDFNSFAQSELWRSATRYVRYKTDQELVTL